MGRPIFLFNQVPGQGSKETLNPVMSFVLERFADEISLDDLAAAAGLSRYNFCRRFHRECGVTPMRWLWTFRTLLAAEFIRLDPTWSLTDVAFSCGFTSSAHFSRSFKGVVGQSPSLFRKIALSGAQARPGAGYDFFFTGNRAAVLKAAEMALIDAKKASSPK